MCGGWPCCILGPTILGGSEVDEVQPVGRRRLVPCFSDEVFLVGRAGEATWERLNTQIPSKYRIREWDRR